MEKFDNLKNRPYFSDRPIDSKNDYLWNAGRRSVRQEINRVARHIVGPLSATAPVLWELSNSMTFAVYGQWGIGKSSVLSMIQEEAEKLAEQEQVKDRLHFCPYDAPRYQSLPYDAFTTLAYSILAMLSGDKEDVKRHLLDDAIMASRLDELVPPGADSGNPARAGAILQRITISLAKLIDFDKIVSGYLRDLDGKPHVLVVMIDDLDRCSKGFIWQVLNAIQQLSGIKNIFFILAADQARLQGSLKEQLETVEGARNPNYALEKYVQHYIILPDMDEELLKMYVGSLRQEALQSQLFEAFENEQNIVLLHNGLQELTPRSIKRCFNTIGSQLEERLQNVAEDQWSLVIKDTLLEYSWSNFYYKYLRPIKSQQTNNAFASLEKFCREFFDSKDSERLEFELKRLASIHHYPEWASIEEKLALYLGTLPCWFYSEEKSVKDLQGQDIIKKANTSELELERMVREARSEEAIEGPEQKFARLYVLSQAAENDRTKSLGLALEIYKLVSGHRENFSKGQAAMVGNVAVDAERFGAIELAKGLYELALELDPEQSGIIQNYIDFIINTQLAQYYELAEGLLQKLKEEAHAKYRPERTLLLQNRLNKLTGKDSSGNGESSEQYIDAFLHDPSSRQQFNSIMTLLKEINDFQNLRRVAQAYFGQAGADSAVKYVAVRGLADTLASSPNEEDELEAMDIYRYLLDHLGESSERPDIQHNYATLLYKYDYDDEAGKQWFEAYNRKLTDRNIRQAYSNYLLRARRADLAAAVTESQPVQDIILYPSQKKLPDHFLDQNVERWWEKLYS